MKRKLFGTDGIRGRVGEFPMVPEAVMRIGNAVVGVLSPIRTTRPKVLVGKDPRESGDMLEAALTAGCLAAGADVHLCDVLPTPAVALLTQALDMDAGIVISASHNPAQDNGLKVFVAGGRKLPDEWETRVEERLEARGESIALERTPGRIRRLPDGLHRYVAHCLGELPRDFRLSPHILIVVDCANGAMSEAAPLVLHSLMGRMAIADAEPNGININHDCGATCPDSIAHLTEGLEADIGLSFDGDGDRLVMADANGRIYQGDHLLYVLAVSWKEQGILRGGVVGTRMTNRGLVRALEARGIPFAETDVGDRYVLEELVRRDWNLGGEPSGHLFLRRNRNEQADALVAALHILKILADKRMLLSDATAGLTLLPQRTISIPTGGPLTKHLLDNLDPIQSRMEQSGGRLFVRSSGTEPLIRVTAEHEDGGAMQAGLDEAVLLVRKDMEHHWPEA